MPPNTKPANELEKPSLLSRSTLFASINIAICDADIRLAQLVKNILSTLGCNQIFIVHDGQEVVTLMRETVIDIVITDWQIKTLTGIELAQYLRQSLDSPNRIVPIVMLTARNDRQDIQAARDVGISEYLIKPFSAKTLMERVHAVVEEPRGFIICKNYIGPDRRRVSSLALPPDPDSSRHFSERKPPLVVPKDFLKQLILDDIPRMIMPDYTLKQKIGMEVPADLLTNPLTVAQSQEEIQKAEIGFTQAMLKDVNSLQEAYRIMTASPDNAPRMINKIKDSAYSIKSRAGIFGYVRATEVANQLYNFCRRHYDKNNKHHLIIIEKHIQTISVIFASKLTGDGGQIGAELMRDLARLINKYHNKAE